MSTPIVRIRHALALMVVLGMPCVASVQAAQPRYADVVLSDAADGKAKNTFQPGTPKLFLSAPGSSTCPQAPS